MSGLGVETEARDGGGRVLHPDSSGAGSSMLPTISSAELYDLFGGQGIPRRQLNNSSERGILSASVARDDALARDDAFLTGFLFEGMVEFSWQGSATAPKLYPERAVSTMSSGLMANWSATAPPHLQ
jgi:hypothetical protein